MKQTNPSAQDKLFGTKGFLRRDNKVYKINLANAFSGTDDKENFYLKKMMLYSSTEILMQYTYLGK